jgi:hypothetical protein
MPDIVILTLMHLPRIFENALSGQDLMHVLALQLPSVAVVLK